MGGEATGVSEAVEVGGVADRADGGMDWLDFVDAVAAEVAAKVAAAEATAREDEIQEGHGFSLLRKVGFVNDYYLPSHF